MKKSESLSPREIFNISLGGGLLVITIGVVIALFFGGTATSKNETTTGISSHVVRVQSNPRGAMDVYGNPVKEGYYWAKFGSGGPMCPIRFDQEHSILALESEICFSEKLIYGDGFAVDELFLRDSCWISSPDGYLHFR